MAFIPENEVTASDMTAWHEAKKEAARWKATEILLRSKIFKFFFREPTEGTNTAELADGYALKGKYIIDRKVDEATFANIRNVLLENKIKPDEIVRWKPELVLSKYRELTEEQRRLFDQCLTIKPGSPQLDLVKPKE